MSNATNPTLGVVILNYNDVDETLFLVNKLKRFSEIDHIVVVDNCSSDDSPEKLFSSCDGTWTLICTRENRGYAAGNNIGIRYLAEECGMELIAIANPDVSFSNSFVRIIKQDFGRLPDYGILTGVQYGRDGKVYYHAFWKAHNVLSCYLEIMKKYPFLGNLLRLITPNDAYVKQQLCYNTDVFPTGTVSGCLFFARTELFKLTGGFDEGTFLFYEEDILAKKVEKMNYKIGVDPRIRFMHKGSSSISKAMPQLSKELQMLESCSYYFHNYVSRNVIDAIAMDGIINLFRFMLPLMLKGMRWMNRAKMRT